MIIDRSSWHYGVLVRTYSPVKGNPAAVPKTVNFCTYWRRVFLYAPLMLILSIIVGVAATPVAIAAAIVVGAFIALIFSWGFLWFCAKVVGMFFIGRRQVVGFRRAVKVWFKAQPSHPDRAFRRYKSIVRIWGYNIYPVGVAIALLVGFVGWKFLQNLPRIAASAMQHTEVLGVFGRIVIGAAFLALMVMLWRAPRVREARSLTGQFIKAKKQRICPLIEFVGEFPQRVKTAEEPQTS